MDFQIFKFVLLFFTGMALLFAVAWWAWQKERHELAASDSIREDQNAAFDKNIKLGTTPALAHAVHTVQPVAFQWSTRIDTDKFKAELQKTYKFTERSAFVGEHLQFLTDDEYAEANKSETWLLADDNIHFALYLSADTMSFDPEVTVKDSLGNKVPNDLNMTRNVRILIPGEFCENSCRWDITRNIQSAIRMATINIEYPVKIGSQRVYTTVLSRDNNVMIRESSMVVPYKYTAEAFNASYDYSDVEYGGQAYSFAPTILAEFTRDVLKRGENCILFGKAGAGKTSFASYVLGQLQEQDDAYIVLLNSETLQHLKSNSHFETLTEFCQGKENVVFYFDEAQIVSSNKDFMTAIISFMEGQFKSRLTSTGATVSVLLSLNVPENEVPEDLVRPGRAHLKVSFRGLPAPKIESLAGNLKKEVVIPPATLSTLVERGKTDEKPLLSEVYAAAVPKEVAETLQVKYSQWAVKRKTPPTLKK